ncbi:MAG: tRNA (5-methylaminomethyl-2-thiouridine)(34)-methyltransferase MnmD [Paracoccaceae bacterium]|jgi:tRNA U34 5-methylaminomethyl-2-thiouridine-forming methyltransferase MnmC|nr:tRNA (5-methylaminomethyl-2-thiouridine)(34)-methyltransferase MnmD [Paracoccaceae bacterium]
MAGDQSREQVIGATAVEWRAGEVPVSTHFGDPYYSLEDGLAETRHVCLAGNGLPGRLTPGFRVAELGVGTGLNLLALAEAAGDVPVLYLGFEAFPLTAAEVARALAPFESLAPLARQLGAAWRPEGFAARIGSVEAGMVVGDARRLLPVWQSTADAWFLDGFAPAKNPELWEPSLMREVARHTAPGGTFATYTAAGAVRRALGEAGFSVERVPGYGRKRHMSRGVLPEGGGA